MTTTTIIDDTLLASIGIHLNESELATFREHAEKELQQRVGLAIADELDDDQLTELLQLTEAGDQTATTAWLHQNVPDYQQIVADETDILIGELAENADTLSATV